MKCVGDAWRIPFGTPALPNSGFSFGGYAAARARPRSRPPSVQRGYHAPRPPRGTQFPAHLQSAFASSPKRRGRSQPTYAGREGYRPEKSPKRCWPCRRCGDPPGPGDGPCTYGKVGPTVHPRWATTTELLAEGLRPPNLAPVEKASALLASNERPRTPELKQLGEAFLALQREEQQLAQLRSVWEQEDARAREALERVELAAQRVAMSKAQLPEDKQAAPEEAAKTSPARPAWLAKKPAWLDKQTGVRLKNGQLGTAVSGGWVAVQHANGTFGFVPNPAASQSEPPKRPASASVTSRASGSRRTAPSVASSRRAKARPSSAPGGPRGARPDWAVTEAAKLLNERLNRIGAAPSEQEPDERGARVVAGRIFVDGVPANPGMNSVVNC